MASKGLIESIECIPTDKKGKAMLQVKVNKGTVIYRSKKAKVFKM